MTIAERLLGRSGLATTPLMLGGNVFGWTADRAASFAVLDAFVEGGGRLIDTADMYSDWIPGLAGGESESMIGAWLASRGCRERVLVATKILRALGASHYSEQRLLEARALGDALGIARYEVLQPRYNLLERAAFEGSLQRLCVDQSIGVVPFYALASGFLTGKYPHRDDLGGRQRGAEVEKYLNPLGLGVLDALDAVAAQAGASQAQVALAWLMARPGVTAPIASATSAAQAAELTGAMQLVLGADQLALLDRASAPRQAREAQ